MLLSDVVVMQLSCLGIKRLVYKIKSPVKTSSASTETNDIGGGGGVLKIKLVVLLQIPMCSRNLSLL